MSDKKPDTMLLLGNIQTTGECITVRAELESLDKAIESFERFLRGCGFVFDGELVIMENTLDTRVDAPSSTSIN